MGFREEAKKKLDRMGGEGDDGGNVHRWEFGVNHFRFLPIPMLDDPDGFYLEVPVHYGYGDMIRCVTPPTMFFGRNKDIPANATKCPICRKFNAKRIAVDKKYGRNNEKSKAAWLKIKGDKPSNKFFAVGFDPTADEPELKVAILGSQIMQDLLTEYVTAGIRFFNVRKGREMMIKKKKTGPEDTNVKYTVVRGASRADVTEIWEQVEGEIDKLLNSVVPAKMTVEEIAEIVKQNDVAFDEAEKEGKKGRDSDDESDEESEPEKPDCFGDADIHDPKSDLCQECPFFKRCKKTPDVAEAYEEGKYEKKKKRSKLDEVEAKVNAKAKGKSPRDEDSDDESEDDDNDDES